VILDLIAGERWTCGVHIVATLISFRIEPDFPIVSPGFFASMIRMLRCMSKMSCVISASCGTICRIFASVSSWGIRRDLSARSSRRFFIVFTISFIAASPFLKNAVSDV